jgi:hypothetical protein
VPTILKAFLLLFVMGFGALLFALASSPAAAAGAGGPGVRRRVQPDRNRRGLAFRRIPERSAIYAKDGSVLATPYLDENPSS